MRNLWIFLRRYNALFLFIFFFIIGLILVIRNNIYQKSIVFNSSNEIVGSIYLKANNIQQFFKLSEINDSLAKENALLKNKLLAINEIDSNTIKKVTDSTYQQRYTLLPASVVKNSISFENNIITINKGSIDGVEKDMAVISVNKGIVGFIQDVSPNFATIRSLLNSQTAISVMLKNQHIYGSLVWGDNNYNFQKAFVKEIPNHIKVKVGDTVITSGSGGFPKGIEVGRITKTNVSTGDSFLTLETSLFTNFSNLQIVYIIKDKQIDEVKNLELKTNNEF